MGTGEGLGAFLATEEIETGLGLIQPTSAEDCTNCGASCITCTRCDKCFLCCVCGTLGKVLSDEELVTHDDPAHECHPDCYAWYDPEWPAPCGDED